MSSLIEEANIAIMDLGHDPIASFDDGTTTSDVAKKYHLVALDIILARWDWNFARTRKTPSPASENPLFGFPYAFTLPTDPYTVKVIEVLSGEVPLSTSEYQVEGREVLSQTSPINLIYTARITDPNQWSPGFSEAYRNKLSAMMAIPLTRNRSLKADMETLYRINVATAIAQSEDASGSYRTTYDGVQRALDE